MSAFFRTVGGPVIELDVPAGGLALELHLGQIARGDLVPVDADTVEKVVDADGTYRFTSGVALQRDPATDAADGDDEGGDDDAGPGDEKARLLAVAEERGIEVNPRWGVKRLAEAIGE